MSGPERSEHSPSQVSVAGRIDSACEEFERAWKSGESPCIEDVLAQHPPEERPRLLAELLEIEFDFRQRADVFVRLEDYCYRFPDQAQQVEAIYRRCIKTPRLGDYELLEEIGRGGMGVVYKARQIYLNQVVAIKVLPKRYLDDVQAVARFRREMQSIGSMEHPNIVRAYNAGEARGVHFLVMEYVDGIDLQQLVGDVDGRPLPLGVGAACEAIRQAALGLQHAHQQFVVHRDVKPANLVVTREGVVKLLDLGLAKFHAERRPSDSPSGDLTRAGATVGTVDFMAPEQWEGSSAVDVRSDIYSLGCTLFFLLTGQPPYGGPAYDTNRKKLMAHVVAPIPSLVDYRPDCPVEVDQILARMMAKEPGGRFSNPGEVAAALEEFADPQELTEEVAMRRDTVGRAGPSGSKTKNLGTDTAKKLSSSAARKKSFSRRKLARPWHRRPAVLASLALATVLSIGLIVWASNRSAKHGPQPPTPAPPGPAQPTIAGLAQIQADLTLLPGLNGQWWFDEMPWLTPFVRQSLSEALGSSDDPAALLSNNPSEYFDPNVAEVQKWLWKAVSGSRRPLTENQSRLLDELKNLSDSNLDDDKLAGLLAENLQRFVDQHPAKWPAVDRHMLALLQHRLAMLNNDRTLAETAKKSYDEALAQYAEPDRGDPQLRLLCLADSALLCSRVLGNYKEAKLRFDEVLAQADLPLLLRVETLVVCGAEASARAMTSGDYEDHRFVQAKTALESSEAGKRSHPLAAYIGERYAWSLMDQWKVEDAAKQFSEAYNIRLTNKREKNPYAAIYVFHNRHGIAMTARYRGNIDSARRIYKSLVEEEKAALDEAEHQPARPGLQRYLRDLRERWSNSMERWADCELYGGAASGMPVHLAQAGELYEKAAAATAEGGTGAVFACKRAIVLALRGKTDEAQKVLAALDKAKKDILGSDRERAALARQVADAVIVLKEKGLAEGQKSLRAFLDQFRLNPTYSDSSRRETLELQLFCAELLLSTELESGDAKSAPLDLKYLDALLATFNGRKDTRPFLRRYYELAIRACDRSELVQVAHYLLESRTVGQQQSLRSNQVTLLLFNFTPNDNFAIFFPQDGRSGKRIPLELTRQQIKEAAARGKPLHLNDELVQLVKEELRSGRSIEVSWSDAMSRPSEDENALSDSEWPFNDQLDLASLKKSPQHEKSGSP